MLWAAENGITYGTGAGTFSPDAGATRGQMLTFLCRTMGEPGKTGEGAWYGDTERWASRRSLTDGTARAYAANDACPRADVAHYLWKMLG